MKAAFHKNRSCHQHAYIPQHHTPGGVVAPPLRGPGENTVRLSQGSLPPNSLLPLPSPSLLLLVLVVLPPKPAEGPPEVPPPPRAEEAAGGGQQSLGGGVAVEPPLVLVPSVAAVVLSAAGHCESPVPP